MMIENKVMKKQNYSSYLSAVLILFLGILTVPNIAHAGSTNVGGAADDSSSSAGGAFNSGNQEIIPQIAPDTAVTVGGDSLNTSADTQKSFEKIAGDLNDEFQQNNNIVISLLLGKEDAGVAGLQIETALVNLGADSSLVQQLKVSLSEVFSDCQSQLAICQNVNIEKLDLAIKSYNKLVKSASPELLIKLKENEYFKDIFKQLKQLRQALAKS
jgi:hypothetical protein